MDKYEYKLRLEEIKTLNRKGRFQEAAQVADTIDWKKVRNISTLGIISDVYKINRRFEDAKEMLLLANEKSPQNRRIIYALCDLTVKMGQVVEAVEYYKEFVQLAPNDTSKYILLYKIYEAQDISLEERIAVLKEYKKREYNEKWAYELAFLYHRVGLATECVEECDQLILWFGEGKYVTKAMELKRLYVPLSPAQQQAYDRQFGRVGEKEEEPVPAEVEVQTHAEPEPTKEPEDELDIQVKPMDMGEYNTINLQAALAASMREVLEPEENVPAQETETDRQRQEVLPESGMRQMQPNTPVTSRSAVYDGEDMEYQEDVTRMIHDSENWDAQATGQLETEETENSVNGETEVNERNEASEPNAVRDLPASNDQNQQMDELLAQEYDGQISLALPESKAVEKQITGQMNIEEVLAEWEKRKRENQEKRKQETRQWMLQHTGSLFDEFDQQTRDGVLEKLQRGEPIPEELIHPSSSVQADAYDEVEELEEIEEEQETDEMPAAGIHRPMSAVSSENVRPMPANAAARAVMAAEGVIDEVPEMTQKVQKTVPVQQGVLQNAKEMIPQGIDGRTKEIPSREIARRTATETVADREALQTAQEHSNEAAQAGVREAQPAENGQAAVNQPAESEQTAQNQPAESGQTAQNQPVESEQTAQNQPAESGQTTQNQPAESEQTAQNQFSESEQDTEEARSAQEETKAETQVQEKQSQKSGSADGQISEKQLQEHIRSMTEEEKELFAPFVPTKGAMRQLVNALDKISLSAYTGNMIISGAPGSNMMKLAKNMIREIRATDQNFSGKVAKISGDVLNERKADGLIAKISNGALIVEKAGKLSEAGAENLAKALNQDHTGIIVFLLDNKRAIGRLLERSKALADCFTARFDIAALDSATLVKYGCQYAYNLEYSIDELGRLALHTRIEDMQTNDHAVTVEEVREIVDEAIESAERKSLRHFLDILFRKRYDEDDMIILRERDFI